MVSNNYVLLAQDVRIPIYSGRAQIMQLKCQSPFFECLVLIFQKSGPPCCIYFFHSMHCRTVVHQDYTSSVDAQLACTTIFQLNARPICPEFSLLCSVSSQRNTPRHFLSYTMRTNLLNWCNLVSISKKSRCLRI